MQVRSAKLTLPLLCGIVFLQAGEPNPIMGQSLREGVSEAINPPIVPGSFSDRGDRVVWEGRRLTTSEESDYVRIHFAEITSPPEAKYTVVLRGADKLLARYPSDQFSKKRSFYSEVLFTNTVLVQVVQEKGASPPVGLSFKIDRWIYEVNPRGRQAPQSVVPDWLNFKEIAFSLPTDFRLVVKRALESIAKVYIGDGEVCTGFLVSSTNLMTNYHCAAHSEEFIATKLQPRPTCSDIEIHFNFEAYSSESDIVRTFCSEIVQFDPKLDYAILRLDKEAIQSTESMSSSKKADRPFLTLASRPISNKEEVFILHHPAGLTSKLSLHCSAYPLRDRALIEHDCATIGGSSGAPVITKDGTVIGLHYSGAYNDEMTIKQISELIGRGHVFRNKAKPAYLIREKLNLPQ